MTNYIEVVSNKLTFNDSEQTAKDLDSLVKGEGTTFASCTWTVDEDDMSSDSAVKVPTQQSVKKYVDDNAGGFDFISINSNLSIAASRNASAETISIKTKAGTDPSASDTISIAFRDAALTTGGYSVLTLSSAYSITIPSTATMGVTSAVPFRLWLVGINDGGTFRLGVVNTQMSDGILPLSDDSIISSTLMDTSSDSAGVIYTGTAVTSKAMRVLGYLEYTLATAGTWGTAPSKIQVYGYGVKLPGDVIQVRHTLYSAVGTTTTAMPYDDTIPQNTEGAEFMTQAITPMSAANFLDIDAKALVCHTTNGTKITMALFIDSVADALAAVTGFFNNGELRITALGHRMLAGAITARTLKIRIGGSTGSTTTFNGASGSRYFGAIPKSSIRVTEYMG